MRKRVVIDGTPDEVKVSCPVWREGKSGDNFKRLPITIGESVRRLCAGKPDGGAALPLPGQPNRHERLHQPGEKRSQPVPPDDGAAPHVTGRAQIHAERQLHRNENRRASHAGAAAAVPGLGHPVPGALPSAGAGAEGGRLRQ